MIDCDKFRLSFKRLDEQHDNRRTIEDALPELTREGIAASATQRFETCQDSVWKLPRRHLTEELDVAEAPICPRPSFRLGDANGPLPSPVERRPVLADARRDTTHDYHVEEAKACSPRAGIHWRRHPPALRVEGRSMALTQAIDITPGQRETVTSPLSRHLPNTETWVHGSRVRGLGFQCKSVGEQPLRHASPRNGQQSRAPSARPQTKGPQFQCLSRVERTRRQRRPHVRGERLGPCQFPACQGRRCVFAPQAQALAGVGSGRGRIPRTLSIARTWRLNSVPVLCHVRHRDAGRPVLRTPTEALDQGRLAAIPADPKGGRNELARTLAQLRLRRHPQRPAGHRLSGRASVAGAQGAWSRLKLDNRPVH